MKLPIECKRCRMTFSNEEMALYHTLMYHTEDWYKIFQGEKLV